MSNLRRRVARLERDAGTDAKWCACGVTGSGVTVCWDTDPTPLAPQVCPVCGKPVRVVLVTWDLDSERGQTWA